VPPVLLAALGAARPGRAGAPGPRWERPGQDPGPGRPQPTVA